MRIYAEADIHGKVKNIAAIKDIILKNPMVRPLIEIKT